MEEDRLRFDGLEPALHPSLLGAVAALGFTQMTPVQAATLPLFLGHKDVCVEAVTGSGKTLAFVLPALQLLLRREKRHRRHQVGAVILSPTRELARQTFQVTQHFIAAMNAAETTTRSHPFRAVLLMGGTDVTEELQQLREDGVDVLVGTPGRTLDILERSEAQGMLDLKEVEVLVLDEADTLLDMGFAAAVTEILGKLPRQRRTGLFSATQTREVKALARAGLRNPAGIRVSVNTAKQVEDAAEDGTVLERSVPATLRNFYCTLRADAKLDFLVDFLRQRRREKVLVFMLTCAAVDFFTKALRTLRRSRDLTVEGLHGRMSQKKRTLVYEAFAKPRPAVLVCTDVAARGLDVPDVDWIVQFDPPQDPSFFIHRVGRAARAGRRGNALTLILEEEEAYVNFLQLKGVPMRQITRDGLTAVRGRILAPEGNGSGAGPRVEPGAGLDSQGRANGASPGEENPGRPAPEGAESAKDTEGGLDPPEAEVARADGSSTATEGPVPWEEGSLAELKESQKRDRDLLELGTRAFISYLRAYKEHQCSYIFQFASLPLADVARSFALFKLPKIGELRKTALECFEPDETVDTTAIPYLDPQREKARRKRLATVAGEKERREAYNAAHPKMKTKKERRAEKEPPKRKRKGKNKRIVEEWDELAREERLYKRMKRGKLSEEDYETLLRQEDDEIRARESDGDSEPEQNPKDKRGKRKQWKTPLNGQRYSTAQRSGKRGKR